MLDTRIIDSKLVNVQQLCIMCNTSLFKSTYAILAINNVSYVKNLKL